MEYTFNGSFQCMPLHQKMHFPEEETIRRDESESNSWVLGKLPLRLNSRSAKTGEL